MTDFEERLRAAMAANVQPPPSGLLAGIRRRHRRHVLRLTAIGAATATAMAVGVPLAVHGVAADRIGHDLGAGHNTPGVILPGPAGASASVPTAGPHTALRDCQNATGGTMSADWKSQSVQAGPLWFGFARPAAGAAGVRSGSVIGSALVIAVSNGHTAVVTAAPSVAGRFRFLNTFNGGNQRYTIAEGSRALKVVGCPAGPVARDIPPGWAPGLTLWWQGYVTSLRGCIPLDVRVPPSTKVIQVTLAISGCKK